MKQEVKTGPMARESSFINLLSGWVQQGVENFFATQRILVDLAMRQNGINPPRHGAALPLRST